MMEGLRRGVVCQGSAKRASLLVLALCAVAAHAAQKAAGPIEITHGGVYSGNWTSNDPHVAAVTIRTDEAVVLHDATVSGGGNLIAVLGGRNGAHVTIRNVTGTALDAGVAGAPRGSFLVAVHFSALAVDHCTMTGTAFGIKASAATPAVLQITNNRAVDLEDRASDGHGGLQPARPVLGHFILLDHVVAAAGAEIAWNQAVQTMGTTSTEDAINIYESEGSQVHPIRVHDNYLEGQSTTVPGRPYTGTALIADGSAAADAAPTAWVVFENNQVVSTAGGGVGIAYGHDVTARNNRVVSCGVDAAGHKYAWGANAVAIWNFYKRADFYNNTITGTTGGMAVPAGNGGLRASNAWMSRDGRPDASNRIGSDFFTNPCMVNGKVNLQAEDAERTLWKAKLAAAGQWVGAR